MNIRTMLVLGVIPTCILCERAFRPTPEFTFACGPCCTGNVSLDAMTKAFLAGARKYSSACSAPLRDQLYSRQGATTAKN